jgi:hypothetical protein
MESKDRSQEQEIKASARDEKAMGKYSGTHRKFQEPRGWALKWDGDALAKMGDKETSR